jgi:hypothetical protein
MLVVELVVLVVEIVVEEDGDEGIDVDVEDDEPIVTVSTVIPQHEQAVLYCEAPEHALA